MSKKWIELFDGLMKGDVPFDQEGYIIVTRFDTNSKYAVIEIVAFKNVKNIVGTDIGVTFHSDGFKTYVVFEPMNYQYRYMEPYLRDGAAHVPLRFNETNITDLPKRDRVFTSKEPYMSQGSFTIERPEEGNLVYYVFGGPDVDDVICQFAGTILNKDLGVPKSSLPGIFALIKDNLSKFHKFVA